MMIAAPMTAPTKAEIWIELVVSVVSLIVSKASVVSVA